MTKEIKEKVYTALIPPLPVGDRVYHQVRMRVQVPDDVTVFVWEPVYRQVEATINAIALRR